MDTTTNDEPPLKKAKVIDDEDNEPVDAEIEQLFYDGDIQQMIYKILLKKIKWINIPDLICKHISSYSKMDIIHCEGCSDSYFFCDDKTQWLQQQNCEWDNGWVNLNGIRGYDMGANCATCWDTFEDRCEECDFGDGDFIDADNGTCHGCGAGLCQAHKLSHEYGECGSPQSE